MAGIYFSQRMPSKNSPWWGDYAQYFSPMAHTIACHLTCHHSVYQTDEWRLSKVNEDFSVCPSYPPLVTVPKEIDDDSLRKVATFRQGGRFPVLSYYHKKNSMVRTSEIELIFI